MPRRRPRPKPIPSGIPPELYCWRDPQWWAGATADARDLATISDARARHRAAVGDYCTTHGLLNA